MTDFGGRAGLGDMTKAVYDTDKSGVVDDSESTAAHATRHQDGGTDEISVAGLVGTTPRALLGDVTAGRFFRELTLIIDDGTNVATLKCTVTAGFNGDTIAVTDNVAKGATTGHFLLDADGLFLTIKHTGLSGNVVGVMGVFVINGTGTALMLHAYRSGTDIVVAMRHPTTGGPTDLTTLANSGDMYSTITYITDA